jgi:hypothetical protein
MNKINTYKQESISHCVGLRNMKHLNVFNIHSVYEQQLNEGTLSAFS